LRCSADSRVALALPWLGVRIEGGVVSEELSVAGIGDVPVRYARCPAGWTAKFEVRMPDLDDLAVVHRLVAPSLREARRSVPQAVRFLRGEPTELLR
jgi:hypothetical protein